ncbi:TRAM domain-containing protein, partial [bacterium]|nr:TRAM domain-containing protein [bacterium]
DNIPAEEKIRRQNLIMEVQQEISLRKNEKLIGTRQKVLIDSYNKTDNISYGRTYRDSPEIDNQVLITGELTPGEFYDIEITDALEYDLIGIINDEC